MTTIEYGVANTIDLSVLGFNVSNEVALMTAKRLMGIGLGVPGENDARLLSYNLALVSAYKNEGWIAASGTPMIQNSENSQLRLYKVDGDDVYVLNTIYVDDMFAFRLAKLDVDTSKRSEYDYEFRRIGAGNVGFFQKGTVSEDDFRTIAIGIDIKDVNSAYENELSANNSVSFGR